MATEEVRVPLLASGESSLLDNFGGLKEDLEVHYPLQTARRELRWGGEKALDDGRGSRFQQQGLEPNNGGLKRTSSEASCSRKKKQYSGSEMIVAVFVVAFDTKKGNIVEWKYPSEVMLEGIEFKSMASGLHKITKDFIYFKQNQLYGLSCFEKIPVANQEERGARMKSVGLLAVGYSDLHLHMDFLQRQARSQVEMPGDYGSLEEYFRHYRNPQLGEAHIESVPHIPALAPSQAAEVIQHPVGCFAQFLRFFGPKVFTLWRLALLKKRILLFSQPPIGSVCHRGDLDTECNPQFYVNVTDIDHLESLEDYIACTTEKILQSKTQLYDVFVDGSEFHTASEYNNYLLKTTPEDQLRYQHLNNIWSSDATSPKKNEEDLIFAEYFQELNSQLLRVLMDAADSEDHVLTVEMVKGVQLDPIRDRLFLTELATVLQLNVTVQHHTDMFTCCL